MKNKLIILTLTVLTSLLIGINYVQAAELGCLQYTSEGKCNSDGEFSCLWIDPEANETYKSRGITKAYCNTNDLTYVACGNVYDIPSMAPKVISVVVFVFKFGAPIILIITSMITLIKAITAGSEDNMSKAKSALIKKIIAAILVFYMFSFVQFIISMAAEDEEEINSFSGCLNCFLNNECSNNVYYKTYVYNTWYCTGINNSTSTRVCDDFNNVNNNADSQDEDVSQDDNEIEHDGGGKGF